MAEDLDTFFDQNHELDNRLKTYSYIGGKDGRGC